MSYDLVIRGGTVVDGSGLPRYRADVGISGDRIARLGTIHAPGREEVGRRHRVVEGVGERGQPLVASTQFGLGYIDDCFIFAMNYITRYSYNYNTSLGTATTSTLDHRFMLTIALRTIGSTGASQSVAGMAGLGTQ